MTDATVIPRMDPEMQAALDKAQQLAAQYGPPGPDMASMRAFQVNVRTYWYEGGPAVAEEQAATIPGPYRQIPVMIYRPTKAATLPAFVYFHGGGFRTGNERTNARQMRELAALWGGVAISADYAHIPEQVFPAAVEEGAAVLRWLHENGARWGIDGNRLAFGGTSAGGSVAMGSAIHLGGARTGYLKAGATIVAVLDLNMDTESMRMFQTGFYPSRADVNATHNDYVPDPRLHADPRVNCVAVDPAIVPPVFLAAAELDTLRDSSVNMAKVLAAAGRPHRLKIYPGMTHMFSSYSRTVSRARECWADIGAFLAEHVPAG
jgi:acetyl esterase